MRDVERAEETYRPNNTETEGASIRSQQTLEAVSVGSKFDGGIPGAPSNRPPENAAAPIELDKKKKPQTNPEEDEKNKKEPPIPTDKKKESTTNYEVDKTVQHTKQSIGNIKRLTAAVVVNHRKKVDENGEVTHVALTEDELKEINNLVREAMGYSEKRGDSLTVTNSLFIEQDVSAATVFWKDPENISSSDVDPSVSSAPTTRLHAGSAVNEAARSSSKRRDGIRPPRTRPRPGVTAPTRLSLPTSPRRRQPEKKLSQR